MVLFGKQAESAASEPAERAAGPLRRPPPPPRLGGPGRQTGDTSEVAAEAFLMPGARPEAPVVGEAARGRKEIALCSGDQSRADRDVGWRAVAGLGLAHGDRQVRIADGL